MGVYPQPQTRSAHPAFASARAFLIVGDADGVVVIEREKAAAMMPLAQKKLDDETKRIAGIKRNEALRPPWLEGALRAAGVLKEGQIL